MTESPTDNDATAVHVLGALALELSGTSAPRRDRLAQAEAGELASLIAADLAAFAPDAAELELVTVGAHYDPVELLRPGWPLHGELDALAARAPGRSRGRIVAFGAHDDRLPGDLTPSPDLTGGPLRLVPIVLGGDPARVGPVGDLFEQELLERGMAGAATALAAQSMFGLQVEHARYLTVHDLAAMTSLQYEHAGLGALWPVIETALLAPESDAWLDAPPEPLIRYVDGEARIALFSPPAWQKRYAVGLDCTTEECREQAYRQHQHFEARQRQLAAVLQAHGVVVNFVHCDRDVDCVAALG
ncbi:hypothetical protein GCM10008101_24470 [Lysobacter xinjiangensis]|uniref:Uncharacterized protein n=1 Tax=Cognatilysobacter xinjiangensis TaxID=546892 RepID=A0ABQ3CBR5_9GAMM|nr:hypothetical protein [Lysobacter xinjiangensis]GGZ69428.1 hypothetical protein GCM10008101_24470 [Lysobacter xinjiangensis]